MFGMINPLGGESALRTVNLQRIFREMPWLWAVQSHWAAHDAVTIEDIQNASGDLVDPGYLMTWWTLGTTETNHCHFHLVSGAEEWVSKVTLPRVCTVYEALKTLQEETISIENIQHMVGIVNEGYESQEVHVLRIRRPSKFAERFYAELQRQTS